MKECLTSRHYSGQKYIVHKLCYAFRTKRWVSDTDGVIIPRKTSIILPQVPPTGRGKMLEVSQL
ncbi:hypothetical protein E2C01_060275 [Portunus trituberculatus]|uniref:Uncharacterized protein n=1 Tax=Portunus trituberculatus TaxID=210409 RepID=A0A5B7H1T8_PORTR|nr:hypothetical protein [Portunus trituberculatus]